MVLCENAWKREDREVLVGMLQFFTLSVVDDLEAGSNGEEDACFIY